MLFNPIIKAVIISILLSIQFLYGQQVVDTSFVFNVSNPAYKHSKGPLILFDEAHNNDMTLEGRFAPLGRVLKQDGYRLESLKVQISAESLNKTDILVVIDALHESNVENWNLPTPSAFTKKEIDVLIHWIEKGGNLLLVADHMPFPGAVKDLSSQLGVEWHNGFVIDSVNWGMSIFSRHKKTLFSHPIIEGRNVDENVKRVASYYGSGFRIKDFSILGIFGFRDKNTVSYETRKAWDIFPNTHSIPANELFQAAVLKRGKGRVVLVGEASLFSAQLVGKNKNPVGINYPNNNQNLQFVLNTFHWLSRLY